MYFPYLRGKQYELILLRENSKLLQKSGFIPIIEPVKKNLGGLTKTAKALIEADCPFIFVINPVHGAFKFSHSEMLEGELQELATEYPDLFIIGFIVDEEADISEIRHSLDNHPDSKKAIIHYGYTKPKLLNLTLSQYDIEHHIFISDHASETYRRFFADCESKILIKDCFKRRSNKEYKEKEFFSDTHFLFKNIGMTGFGDFTVVSDDYSDSGGPAYAVAIHLTDFENQGDIEDDPEYLAEIKRQGGAGAAADANTYENMVIHHYVSDSNTSTADPGGKFLEALRKAVTDIDNGELSFVTNACLELKELHERKHYPGLGYVKKLAMQHHIELLSHHQYDNQE